MKKNEFIGFKAKTAAEIKKTLIQKKKELVLKKDRRLRKEIAQLATLIREKEIAKKE
jgi:ribosomal protein L29